MNYALDDFITSTTDVGYRTLVKRLHICRVAAPNGNVVTIRYNADLEEYQVTLLGCPDSSYFTNDPEDARDTAIAMLKEAGK